MITFQNGQLGSSVLPTAQPKPTNTLGQFYTNTGIGSGSQVGTAQLTQPKGVVTTGGGTGGTGGGGGTGGAPAPAPQPSGPTEAQLREQQVRNDINSGYDAYFGQLDDMINNGLPGQRSAQENIANSQYDQGVSNLTTQRNLGQQDLAAQSTKADTQQGKTLQDLSDNIRNLFQSGNVYLGAKGAGDSSAADQYSYALTKMGSKQRGDVASQYANIHNDINGRESRLNEIYNGQVKDLEFQKNQQVNSIAQWYGEQVNALKMAQAQGQLQKGQDLASLSKDLLNSALQGLAQAKAAADNKRSQLETWAMNHANDINGLRSNLQQVSNVAYDMPTNSTLAGGQPQMSGGGNSSLFGFGNGNDQQKTNIFGQPIR
jgi:hypothetical protein